MNFSEDFLIKWNLRFRFDRVWRKKYQIPFGSKEHLEANQIDIFLDIQEDKLFERLQKKYIESEQDKLEYQKTGKFLKERKLASDKEDELIKKLKLSFKTK